jgi:hypothetical protein
MYFPVATALQMNDWILKFSSTTAMPEKSPTLHNLHIQFFDVNP